MISVKAKVINKYTLVRHLTNYQQRDVKITHATLKNPSPNSENSSSVARRLRESKLTKTPGGREQITKCFFIDRPTLPLIWEGQTSQTCEPDLT